MTRLTVLLPVFNGMPYLPQACESILTQTFQDLRLLVVNDGSTDESIQFLRSLEDPRVEVIDSDHRGLGSALNLGLSHCKTEFIARMDADDVSLPRRFEHQLDFLARFPDIGVVGTQFRYFGGDGRFVVSPALPVDHKRILAELEVGNLALVHASLVFRAEVLELVGGYRISGMGEDWDLFLRLSESTQLANLSEILYHWRLHPSNTDMRRIGRVNLGTSYALECGRCRRNHRTEPTFEEFSDWFERRPWHRRLSENLKLYSLAQYRKALAEIACNQPLRGYLRLMRAAACSPRRTLRRMFLALRPHDSGAAQGR